jgi:hypothetical protein
MRARHPFSTIAIDDGITNNSFSLTWCTFFYIISRALPNVVMEDCWMGMLTSDIPSPDDILADLDPIIPDIYRALEAAQHEALAYFRDDNHVPDCYLFAALFRYRAKHYLAKFGLMLDDIPNNGLCITYLHYTIRILKRDEGRIPAPGPSLTRQGYYAQEIPLPYFAPLWYREQADKRPVNLLIVWDTTRSLTLTGLVMACPKSGDADRDSARMHWRVPLPNPAFQEPKDIHSVPRGQEVDDVPYSLVSDNNPTTGRAQ